MAMETKRSLVLGGTGYLGQHLLQSLSETNCCVAYTYHSSSPLPCFLFPRALGFHVDLGTGNGLDSILQEFGKPDVVVNCAAISIPRVCENDPASAMSVNASTPFVDWLNSFSGEKPLLVQLSTDQVYEGVKSFYREDEETRPINVYGKSKLASEQQIVKKYSNYAILRSSIIFGPQTAAPVPKSLPIQWIDDVLSKREPAAFFHDEFRCPVFVKDVVAVILFLARKWISDGEQMKLLLNVGGPNRLSRAEMAEVVAKIRGYSTSLINQVSSSSVDRGVASPADISMDLFRLTNSTNVVLTPFTEGVKLTLGIL